MQVWVAMTKAEGAAGHTVQVLRSVGRAYDVVERFATHQNVRIEDDSVDAGHDPTSGRVVWFAPVTGEGPEARVEGPFEIEG